MSNHDVIVSGAAESIHLRVNAASPVFAASPILTIPCASSASPVFGSPLPVRFGPPLLVRADEASRTGE